MEAIDPAIQQGIQTAQLVVARCSVSRQPSFPSHSETRKDYTTRPDNPTWGRGRTLGREFVAAVEAQGVLGELEEDALLDVLLPAGHAAGVLGFDGLLPFDGVRLHDYLLACNGVMFVCGDVCGSGHT